MSIRPAFSPPAEAAECISAGSRRPPGLRRLAGSHEIAAPGGQQLGGCSRLQARRRRTDGIRAVFALRRRKSEVDGHRGFPEFDSVSAVRPRAIGTQRENLGWQRSIYGPVVHYGVDACPCRRTTVRLGEPDATLGSSPKEPVGACFAGTCVGARWLADVRGHGAAELAR